MEISITQLQLLLYKYIGKKKPFMMKGAPGIGKSDSIRQACQKVAKDKKLKYHEGTIESKPNPYIEQKNELLQKYHSARETSTVLSELKSIQEKIKECDKKIKEFKVESPEKFFRLVDVRISQLDPSDLRGIPFPDGNKTKWLIPSWLPDDGEGVLFFDEINLAPPSIQAACYQLILDRRLGDYILPDGWTIVAAGNRSTDSANVFPMAAPLKNRFSHASLSVPSEKEWREWAFESNIKSDIIAFMAFKPTLLFKFEKTSNDDAFPTPRTWALASYMTEERKGYEKADLEEDLMITTSCVGEAAALEYNGFLMLRNKVDLDDILKNPSSVTKYKEISLKYTIISGLSEKYRSNRKNLEKILLVINHLDSEFGIFLLRLLRGARPKTFAGDLTSTKTWEELFDRFHKFIF